MSTDYITLLLENCVAFQHKSHFHQRRWSDDDNLLQSSWKMLQRAMRVSSDLQDSRLRDHRGREQDGQDFNADPFEEGKREEMREDSTGLHAHEEGKRNKQYEQMLLNRAYN